MTVIYPTTNHYPDGVGNQPVNFGYDLQEEKKRIAEATEEIKKELLEKWQKKYAQAEIFPSAINSLNPALIDFLLSFQHTLFYNEIGQKFKLNQKQRNALPIIAWNICLNKKWETTESSLQTDLNLSPQTAASIASLIKQKILSQAKELADKPFVSSSSKTISADEVDSKISLPLSEALRIHPEIGEQLVTSEKISLRNFPYPVRPSVKNWLADYTFHLGYKKHETMARSQYLFQGVNAKKLPATEKQKLAYLLKSFDENSPVTVNKKTKQVVFSANNDSSTSNASHSNVDWRSIANGPAIIPTNTSLVNSNLPKALIDQYRPVPAPKVEQKNINALQFSYHQTLPYEKTLTNSVPNQAPARNFPISSHKNLIEKPGAKNPNSKPLAQNPPVNLSLAPNPPQNIVNLKSANSILSP